MDPKRLPPKRSLGQNFLVDPNIQRRIVEAAELREGDEVVEVGPGRGALTRHLTELGLRLTLVELDDVLARHWEERFSGDSSVTVVHGDILALPLSELSRDPTSLHVVGNIPYNITAPLLFHLLAPPRPQRILVMVQREVAERVVAPPGGKTYGALSVGVRSVAKVERVLEVPRGAFRPRPKVDSTVLRITPRRPSPLDPSEEAELRRLVRAVFQWRRKQLRKILRDHPELSLPPADVEALLCEEGIPPTDRPESLSPEAFVRLSRSPVWNASPQDPDR